MAPSDWSEENHSTPDENDETPLEASADDERRFPSFSAAEDADELSIDDLEAAYLKALESSEGAEWDLAVEEDDSQVEFDPDDDGEDPVLAEIEPSPELQEVAATHSDQRPADVTPQAAAPEPAAIDLDRESEVFAEPPTTSEPVTLAPAATSVNPARIIEACLFVGGHPLSAKKLASLLDGNNEPSVIETLIDQLNLEYSAQARPYEIRLGDGGYRLSLRSEFEAVRSRVYGVGPRDVKLSQDVLEVLALVAYQQPISQAAVEACKPNSANLLRQLLRRELISLTRIDQTRNGVEYSTTPRFLQLFGLGQLSELPRPEDLSIR